MPDPLWAFHKLRDKPYFVKLLRTGFFFSDVAASIEYPKMINNGGKKQVTLVFYNDHSGSHVQME